MSSSKKLKISDGELATRVANLFATDQLTKNTVKLGNVDNTSDLNKVISTATATELAGKASTSTTINGFALSTSSILLGRKDLKGAIASVSTSSNVSAWETIVAASAASAPITITLPSISSSSLGQYLAVVKTDNSANIVSVVPASATTLNGTTSAVTLANQWDAYIIANDGTSGAYTIAKPGGGASSNIFQLNGSSQAYTTYVTGIGTSTPAATLDVETAPTFVAANPNYGVAQSPVDEFGYANIVSTTGSNSISVAAHTISVGGVNYSIATTNFSSLARAPVYYVYSDGLTGAAALSPIPNELYLAPALQPGSYLSFENGFADPFWGAWGNVQAGPFSMDSTTSKFGTTSCKLAVAGNVLQMMQQNKTSIENYQHVYLPVWPTWQFDAWFYVSAVGSVQTQFMGYRSGNYASGYGFGLYNISGGSQSMGAYISTNGSSWNVASLSAVGTIPLNQWFQMGIRYDGANFVVYVNGTTTSFASNVNLNNPGSASTYYASIGAFSGAGTVFNVDEVIITPYARAFAPSSAFTYTNNCITGSPFAALLTGASLTDGYNLNWYGSLVASGPTYPASNPSFTLNGSNAFIWSPLCPNLNQYGEWTIEAYINTSVVSTSIPLVDLRASNNDFSLFIQLNSTTQMALFTGTTGTTWNIFSAALITVPSSTWFHFALTYSATRGGYAAYLNGVLKLSSATTSPIVPPSQIVLGTTSSSFHSGTTFTVYMNCFRITPTLVYTGAFTAPSTMLTANVSRDLITASTGACTTQGSGASASNKRVYLGSVRLDIQRVRHWTPKQAQQPLAKFGQLSVWRDGTLTTPTRSFTLPTTSLSNPRGYLPVLRGDGRLFIGGDFAIGDGGTGVPVTSGTYDQYWPVTSQTVRFSRVVAGWSNYFCIDTNNVVWACGYNLYGVFGDGTTTNRTVLSPIYYATSSPTLAISSTYSLTTQSLFIVDAGNMYACGSNAFGQLGLGSTTQQNTLTIVPKISAQNWFAVWQFGQASFAITDSASGYKLYACGNNANNILGIAANGGTVSTFTPCVTSAGIAITNVKKVIAAVQQGTATYITIYVILNDNTLYVTGKCNSSPFWTPGTGSQINWSCYGFFGPICDNVVDMSISSGDDDFSALILRADSSLWTLNAQTGGFTPNNVVNSFSNRIQTAVTGTYGEKTPVSMIYGNAYGGYGGNLAITYGGDLLAAGFMNQINNSLGGPTINTNITIPNEIHIRGDRIVDCLTANTTDGTTVYANTFLQTQSGKIYAAGSQYAALTGGKYGAKQTFAPLYFEQ